MTEPVPDKPETANDQKLLKAYLANRDASCPACKYNLRGCEAEKCPECGAVLELQIWSTDLKLGAWLTAILALSPPMAFMLLLTCTIPFSMRAEYKDNSWIFGLFICVLITSALGFLFCRVLLRRNTFLKKPKNKQWFVAGSILFVLLTCTGSIIIGLIIETFV